jgi:hypothetical protein
MLKINETAPKTKKQRQKEQQQQRLETAVARGLTGRAFRRFVGAPIQN